MNLRTIIVVGALLGAAGVGLGAYHAHGLQTRLAKQGVDEAIVAKRVAQGETGVRYHMAHTLALLVVGLLADRHTTRWLSATACCFLIGIVLFSGGLYMLSLGGPEILRHPAFVPVGGMTLILGWCSLAVHGARLRA